MVGWYRYGLKFLAREVFPACKGKDRNGKGRRRTVTVVALKRSPYAHQAFSDCRFIVTV